MATENEMKQGLLLAAAALEIASDWNLPAVQVEPGAGAECIMSEDTHEVWIRRGVLINDDPQRRCYNGCYFKSHVEWSEWMHWMDYPSEEHAERAARLFAREDQQLKVIKKETVV